MTTLHPLRTARKQIPPRSGAVAGRFDDTTQALRIDPKAPGDLRDVLFGREKREDYQAEMSALIWRLTTDPAAVLLNSSGRTET
ncbi:MAG: hypothetical protein HYS12_22175 [Planctomycetes bacterium]|nr:hypothetical protein [Planctomycetota bacterium]